MLQMRNMILVVCDKEGGHGTSKSEAMYAQIKLTILAIDNSGI